MHTKMNLSTVKLAQWDKTQSRELLGLFVRVCIALCTIVAYNIPQNTPDNFSSYPPDNHHCSDDVYLREGDDDDDDDDNSWYRGNRVYRPTLDSLTDCTAVRHPRFAMPRAPAARKMRVWHLTTSGFVLHVRGSIVFSLSLSLSHTHTHSNYLSPVTAWYSTNVYYFCISFFSVYPKNFPKRLSSGIIEKLCYAEFLKVPIK